MTKQGWIYVGGVCLAGAIASGMVMWLGRQALSPYDWQTWLVYAALLTLSLLLKSRFKGKHQTDQGAVAYSPMLVFVFAGATLLPLPLVPLLILVPHLIEWLVARIQGGPHLKAWYIQPFNIATHTLCILGVLMVSTVTSNIAAFGQKTGASPALVATMIAALAYVVVNHLLVVGALIIARGVPWRQSGLLDWRSLMPDFILLVLGFAVALLWRQNPWLIILAIAPLYLLQQSLKVPQLQKEANRDEKTGLSNSRHFRALFEDEWKRAQRFGRPLTLIFGDLDLLRDINNSRGHLAGDKALSVAGQVIRHNLREYDIGGRFGGEEFVIVLPETLPSEGLRIAELIRKDIEHAIVEVAPDMPTFKITMSFGLASMSLTIDTPDALIESADKAMYVAKKRGRNQVATTYTEVETRDYAQANALHSKVLQEG